MSIQSEVFNTVLRKKQKRSTFDLSHDVKMSLDMGNLVPIYIQECVPGDSVKIQSHTMMRFAPLISPVMHRIQVKMEYFFVPNRIIWSDWETFITGSRNGKQLSAEELPVFPTFNLDEVSSSSIIKNGTLYDYLGLPTPESFVNPKFSSDIFISLLPFAAYQRIYDEYYRDENLQESLYDAKPGGFINYNSLKSEIYSGGVDGLGEIMRLRKRAWQHDYFTSALPFAQKGPAVEIPLSTEDLRLTGQLGFNNSQATVATGINDSTGLDGNVETNSINAGQVAELQDGQSNLMALDVTGNIDLDNIRIDNVQGTNSFLTSINDLRTAIRLQEWLETNARGGTRYIESIYAHFGVKSSDKRLQRPEFIGSNRSNVIVSEVMQTSSPVDENDTPQANMAGSATNVNSSRNFKYFCEEHGYIIGLMTVLPDTAYFQGIPRHFSKTEDRLQYYFPEFAHLGEQEIQYKEIYAGGSEEKPSDTFGYIPRYSEYRYLTSRVAGDFRDTLKYWHLGRDFANTPSLNSDFIEADPSKRIFAVQSLPDDGSGDAPLRDFHSLYAHVFHSVKASRLMPKYGTPHL